MAKQFDEGIEELSDFELTEELRGQVVEVKAPWPTWVWTSLLATCVLTLLGGSWTYYYLSRTEDVLRIERLSDRQQIFAWLQDVRRAVRNPVVTTTQLNDAIETALEVTETPLREDQAVPSPFVREKYLVLVEALEGLLRLELEDRIDFDNPALRATFTNQLVRLGSVDLEYWENGLLETEPLLPLASLKARIERHRHLNPGTGGTYLNELRQELRERSKKESFSIVAAADRLGRWFRYNNELDVAERCFDIGRRYVEGYENLDVQLKGKRPVEIDATWHAYASCLEALAELRFQSKEYRQARSYLARLFNTPRSSQAMQQRYELVYAKPIDHKRIEAMRHDAELLSRAIEQPGLLRSYPLVDEHDCELLENVAEIFNEAAENTQSGGPLRRIWELLSTDLREAIYKERLATTHEHSSCVQVAQALNHLIQESDLAQTVTYDPDQFCVAAKAALQRVNSGDHNQLDRTLINREILEQALAGSGLGDFVLSNGQRLTNKLSPQQKLALIKLLENRAAQSEDATQRLRLAQQIEALYHGRNQANIADYAQAISDAEAEIHQALGALDTQESEGRRRMLELKEQMRQLEALDQVQMGRIMEIQEEEERILLERKDLHARAKTLHARLDQVSQHRGVMVAEFQEALENIERQLALHDGQQEQERSLRLHEPLLAQIDSQIALRQHYVNLLKELQDTDGAYRLQELKIARVRIQEEMAILRDKIDRSSGDEREAFLAEADELEQARHKLVQDFDQLFTPIRESVRAIAAQEAEIKQAEKALKQAREGIVHLLGSGNLVGSLQEKSRRRAELLMSVADDRAPRSGFDEELRRINRAIAEDQAQLQMLMQKEAEAQEVLQLFYPHITGNRTLIEGGRLAPLQEYLLEQDKLMQEYARLWTESELWEEIHREEHVIRDNLGMLADTLRDAGEFSEQGTARITRAMQNVLLARKRLSQNKRRLRSNGALLGASSAGQDVSARGYLLDSVELYQMEHELGLQLDETRRTFEKRRSVVARLQKALEDHQALEKQREQAARARDQQAIDRLLPQLADSEVLVQQLSRESSDVNLRLQRLAKAYDHSSTKMENYRQELLPRIDSLRERLIELNQRMTRGDERLDQLVGTLFGQADVVTHSLTSLRESDLENLDELIESQELELTRLSELRSLKQQENYYKAKAVWLIGRSCYEQSLLKNFEDLTAAHSISPETLADQERSSPLLFEEYDVTRVYAEDFLGDVAEPDDQAANYQTWIASLENQALSIFREHLPRYASTGHVARTSYDGKLSRDLDAYTAQARFYTGQIHMNRALRNIHSSRLPPPENPQARSELNLAADAFLRYLDFIQPAHYSQGSQAAQISLDPIDEQEFPLRRRQPLALEGQARISLGVTSSLKGEYLEAIRYYRQLLGDLSADIKQLSDGSLQSAEEVLGQTDPVAIDQYQYQASIHPFYAALLAARPLAHEALYRLGRNYQALGNEKHTAVLNYAPPPYDELEALELARDQYWEKAVAYYSQLVLTQAYSPYRRAALLQRGLLRKQVGDYDGARQDLIAVLGSPTNKGGSLELADMTPKGDLPGELNPGYAQVAFELGKLHLDEENYVAAADAFNQAQQVEERNDFVIKAKVAYADTLIANKRWLLADLLLKELIETRSSAASEKQLLYPIDLWIKRAEVNRAMGLMTAAKEYSAAALQIAPSEMLIEDGIDIDNNYAWTLLETNFRDSIRPLAEACLLHASVALELRDYEEATRYFAYAEKFFRRIPWREDRLLRHEAHDVFVAYREEKLLQARWGQLQALADELLHASFASYREEFERISNTRKQLNPEELLERIDVAISASAELRPHQEEVLSQLHAFWEQEDQKLPERVSQRKIRHRRERARTQHSPSYLSYQTLKTLDRLLQSSSSLRDLVDRLSPQSAEEQLLNQFAVSFAAKLELSEQDRTQMLPGNSNVANLLAIPNASERLASFNPAMREWVAAELRASGLDERAVPVSPQAGILEEVDLYRVSLLSISDSSANYRVMAEIADRYLASPQERISFPERVWRIMEIAAVSAELQQDWKKAIAYNDYLLRDDQRKFFIRPGKEDLHRAMLATASAKLFLGQQVLENSVFVQDAPAREVMESEGRMHLDKAASSLAQLAKIPGEEQGAVATRIRAKQLLKEAGI